MSAKSKAKKLNIEWIEEIKCYRFFGPDGTIERLDFIPVENVPGFSHRIAYNGKLTRKYFGAEFKINQGSALDILDMIRSLGTP